MSPGVHVYRYGAHTLKNVTFKGPEFTDRRTTAWEQDMSFIGNIPGVSSAKTARFDTPTVYHQIGCTNICGFLKARAVGWRRRMTSSCTRLVSTRNGPCRRSEVTSPRSR